MSDTTESSKIVVVPRNFKEFMKFVNRFYNARIRLLELEAARDEAVRAIIKSHEPAISPHRDLVALYLDGIKQYVEIHEETLKKRFGRIAEFAPFKLIFTVSQPALRAESDPELILALKENELTEFLRYEPDIERNDIKAFLKKPKKGVKEPYALRMKKRKLRRILKLHGAYVSQHQTAKLIIPDATRGESGEVEIKEVTIKLGERRFPSVAPDPDFDLDVQD